MIHPEAEALLAGFPALAELGLVEIAHGRRSELRALIETPSGLRVLS